MRVLTTLFLTAAFGSLPGCDKPGDKVPVYPVSGQVLYNGQPAAGVEVYFFPTSAPTIPVVPAHPHGTTGKDGRFSLTTYAPDDGAPEGGYQVLLVWPAEPEEGAEESGPDRLLGWFNVAHSELTMRVSAGTNEMPVIEIPPITAPPQAIQGIPGRN